MKINDIDGKELVYKAQWPLGGDKPYVLIYPDKTKNPFIQMEMSDELRKQLFDNRYYKVYFRGVYNKITNELHVVKFIRHQDWI